MGKQATFDPSLHAVPDEMAAATAVCPKCSRRAPATARQGLRLVFNCARCDVRFYRVAAVADPIARLARG